jgi:hypothetical protein
MGRAKAIGCEWREGYYRDCDVDAANGECSAANGDSEGPGGWASIGVARGGAADGSTRNNNGIGAGRVDDLGSNGLLRQVCEFLHPWEAASVAGVCRATRSSLAVGGIRDLGTERLWRGICRRSIGDHDVGIYWTRALKAFRRQHGNAYRHGSWRATAAARVTVARKWGEVRKCMSWPIGPGPLVPRALSDGLVVLALQHGNSNVWSGALYDMGLGSCRATLFEAPSIHCATIMGGGRAVAMVGNRSFGRRIHIQVITGGGIHARPYVARSLGIPRSLRREAVHNEPGATLVYNAIGHCRTSPAHLWAAVQCVDGPGPNGWVRFDCEAGMVVHSIKCRTNWRAVQVVVDGHMLYGTSMESTGSGIMGIWDDRAHGKPVHTVEMGVVVDGGEIISSVDMGRLLVGASGSCALYDMRSMQHKQYEMAWSGVAGGVLGGGRLALDRGAGLAIFSPHDRWDRPILGLNDWSSHSTLLDPDYLVSPVGAIDFTHICRSGACPVLHSTPRHIPPPPPPLEIQPLD